jgi:hypothetical protein
MYVAGTGSVGTCVDFGQLPAEPDIVIALSTDRNRYTRSLGGIGEISLDMGSKWTGVVEANMPSN